MNLPVRVLERDERAHALLQVFLASKHSPHTRAAYEHDINLWLGWCDTAGVDPLDARHAHVQVWLASLNNAEATRARRLSAVSSWYRWLVREEQAPRNPCDLERQEKPHPDPLPTGGALSDRQVERILAACADDTRTSAVLSLLAYGGIRVGELISANIEDMSLDRGQPILTVHGKGRRRRAVPLPSAVHDRLTAYLRRRFPSDDLLPTLTAGNRSERPLFITSTGRRLDRGQVRRDLQRAARLAGGELADLAPSLSPHWLRRAYVSDLLYEGVPVRDVQYAVGHADPRTTERYDRRPLDLDRHPTYRRAAQLSQRAPARVRQDGDHARR